MTRIKSRVIKKWGYHVQHTIDGNRVLTDCQAFETRREALEAIPALDADLHASIDAGILVL
jgi:hypothetical protein